MNMNKLGQTKDILRDLIAFPTVSSESNLDIISYLADNLGALGARVEIQKADHGQKANLFASLGPNQGGGIVLSGHSDVVPVIDQDWSHDPFEMTEDDGKLFGRGSCDMKGFIACAVAMASEYANMELRRPVHFAFTYDEEVGCIGAQALAEYLQTREYIPSVAIIGEPTSMRVIEGHKGVCEYATRFEGLEGHGSAPDLGVNAVEYAVRYISKLMEIRETLKTRAPHDSRFEPPWTTINIGAFQGGVAPNVIANKAKLEWEFRPVQQSDFEFVHEVINAYVENELLPKMKSVKPDANITTQTIGQVVGLSPTQENEAKSILMALTGANSAHTVAFGTEAGIFQEMGMSAVVCGPGSIEQAHKADEYVAIDQLEQCLIMLEKLGQEVLTV